MEILRPETPEELAQALASTASAGKTVMLGGAFTKDRMAGPIAPSEVNISTSSLNKVLEYEPNDLTISVGAGLPYSELSRVLEENRQMIPLDPPFSGAATVGGILAANTCGPRRRLFGAARDFVIGLKFATLEGKLVQSGGMVVKNVAGLDMGKLMIGSFGTLAAIAVANFKVVPLPPFSRTFVLRFDSAGEAFATRDAMLRGVLQPAALDLLNPPASARLNHEGWILVLQAGGNAAVMDRYAKELGAAQAVEGGEEKSLWRKIAEFTPNFLSDSPEAAVVRVSCTLREVRDVLETLEAPGVVRAGSGVCYGYFTDFSPASAWAQEACARGWKAVVEFAPEAAKSTLDLWPSPGSDFEIMRRDRKSVVSVLDHRASLIWTGAFTADCA